MFLSTQQQGQSSQMTTTVKAGDEVAVTSSPILPTSAADNCGGQTSSAGGKSKWTKAGTDGRTWLSHLLHQPVPSTEVVGRRERTKYGHAKDSHTGSEHNM